MEVVLCPICNIDVSRPYILFGPKDIVKCSKCGLVYVNPRRLRESISSFFEEKYISDQAMLLREFGTWRYDSLQREANAIKSIISSGRILDIGCAGGEFLSLFPAGKWSRYGIDPSRTALQYAESRGIKVYQGILQTALLDCPDDFFNVVTYLDTIFLSPSPLDDLKKIHKLLVEDGILMVEIPGFIYRFMKNVGPVSVLIYRQWCHFSSVSPHLFYFSDRTFRKLLEEGRFQVEKIILEQSPVRGSNLLKLMNNIYYFLSRIIYKTSFGKLNFAGKVVYICRKI